MQRGLLLALVLTACESARPPPPAAVVTAEPLPPAPPPSATVIAPPPSASVAPPPAGPELVWILRDLGDHPHPDIERHQHEITLVVRGDGPERRTPIATETGTLFPENVTMCHDRVPPSDVAYTAKPNDLAQFMLFHAGAVGYAVRRLGPKHGVIIELYDGHTSDPLAEKRVAAVTLPEGPIGAAILLVDQQGRETRYDCTQPE